MVEYSADNAAKKVRFLCILPGKTVVQFHLTGNGYRLIR